MSSKRSVTPAARRLAAGRGLAAASYAAYAASPGIAMDV